METVPTQQGEVAAPTDTGDGDGVAAGGEAPDGTSGRAVAKVKD